MLTTSQPYAPALEILVAEGDRVEPGAKVAAPQPGDERGVPVYASLGGRVAAVEGGKITVDRTQVA
jgi:Na+-translocating ferredoxin:NAD+ oxidoreductase RnfC subunit